VNSSYGALHDATPDRILEGFIEGSTRIMFVIIQDQVEGSSSGTGMTSLPIPQRVPPEAPEFWGERCNLEPVVTNEEEVVRALLQLLDVPRARRMASPNEAPNEYTPEDFGGYVCGYVQQRIPGAFELDYVSSALFDLSLQGAYRVDVVLAC